METTTVKEVEGAMPIKNDFEYIRGLDPQGNPIRLNKADVAKVLEELIGTVSPLKNGFMSKDEFITREKINKGSDFNTKIKKGIYEVASERSSDFVNGPTNTYSYGILVVFAAGQFFIQLYFPDSVHYEPVYRTNYNGRWQKWIKLSTIKE